MGFVLFGVKDMKLVYLFKKFIKSLFNEDYTVQHRGFNLVVGFFSVAIGIVAIFSLVFGNDSIRNTLILVLFGSCILSLIIANVLKKPIVAGIIMSMVPGVLIFPLLFFFRGGTLSGMPIWFTFSLVLPWIIVGSKAASRIFILNAAVATGTIVVGYFYPSLFMSENTPIELMVDNVQTVIMVGLLIGLFVKYKEILFERKENQLKSKDSELQIMMDEAIKANDSKSEFLEKMSHDIKTPMSAVIGFAEIARKNIDDPSRVMDCLDKISASSAHLTDLVDKILDISTLEKGSFRLEEKESNLRAVFEHIIDTVKPQADAKHIKIYYNGQSIRKAEVMLDEAKFNQCIYALLDNAIRYTKAGGTVSIEVSQDRVIKEGAVSTYITIKDTGVGMTKEFVGKAFNAFERENTLNQTSEHGIGLGLTVTKRIIQNMNGTIELKSEIGVGSEFKIFLPLNSYTSKVIPVVENEFVDYSKVDFAGRKILIAEDNEFSAEVLSLSLKNFNMIIEVAEDGAVAVDKVRVADGDYYDLIFMDLQMPYKDGFDATTEIRNLDKPFCKEIPIVAMTASAFDEDKNRAYAVGMNDYIAKPARIEEITKVIGKEFARYDAWRRNNR